MPARSSLVANEPQVLCTARLESFEQPVTQPLDTPAQSQKTSLWQLPPVFKHLLFCSPERTASVVHGHCSRVCLLCVVTLRDLSRALTQRSPRSKSNKHCVAGCQNPLIYSYAS